VIAHRKEHPKHGHKRIFAELRSRFGNEGSFSSVYRILSEANLIHQAKEAPEKKPEKSGLKTGSFRTQMDIQFLPAIEGNTGFEYKISLIHLATRFKYSEIHDNYESKTLAAVYERSLERMPPFF
jgi:hypothetical protein